MTDLNDLNPESFEPGIHKVWLNLVEDPLGRAVKLPVLVARGHKPGPTVGITAAVHGDEVNGIAVIHALFPKLDPTKLRGTVVGIPIVNIPAYFHHSRRAPNGADLNHHFPGSETGNDIQVYAARLLDRFVRHLDVLLDLHTASRGRENCLYVRADMEHEKTARIAYLQRPTIILHNPASDGTLRGAAAALDIPAITIEIGNPSRFQKDYIRRSVIGVRAVLAEYSIVKKRPVAMGPEPTICSESRWLYTQDGGLLRVLPGVTDFVDEGELIAQLVDPFGVPEREYRAPFRGVVIGRAVDPVAGTGARILHLGRPAEVDYPYVRRDV